MDSFLNQDRASLIQLRENLTHQYNDFCQKKLHLDLTRGKPCKEQLDIGKALFSLVNSETAFSLDGTDCRNYGVPTGLPECKQMFSLITGCDPSLIVIGNNSSLSFIYDTLIRSMVFGEIESKRPWSAQTARKWICPVPGYDRHFSITEALGFEMISVPMKSDGPDMDIVEDLVSNDETIKGMWCVPLYSNPDGIVYSENVCNRIASMTTAAEDFRVFWDNSYAVHHLYTDQKQSIPDMLSLCRDFGNPNRIYAFSSTSKITFAGSGISCLAANDANIARVHKQIAQRTIGPEKLNQLRHVRYISSQAELEKIMERHANILRPKFEAVDLILTQEFKNCPIVRWTKPLGGYFISLFLAHGTAKKVVAAASKAGVLLTPAGATYPYGVDPDNSNIRIAPSFLSLDDIVLAVKVLCVCAKLVSVEQALLKLESN